MKQLFTFEEIHGNKFDLSFQFSWNHPNEYLYLRNFETFTCYFWNGDGWSEQANDQFLEIGGSTGEIYDTVTLEQAKEIKPAAFQ
jgi:hypothetical protein